VTYGGQFFLSFDTGGAPAPARAPAFPHRCVSRSLQSESSTERRLLLGAVSWFTHAVATLRRGLFETDPHPCQPPPLRVAGPAERLPVATCADAEPSNVRVQPRERGKRRERVARGRPTRPASTSHHRRDSAPARAGRVVRF
jgi:hypothetical protein